MSTPKIGDRVRVEFEATVVETSCDLEVQVEFANGYRWINNEHCTVLAPPVKVGDVVTAENIERLLLATVVAAPSSTAYERWSNVGVGSDWHGTNGDKTDDVDGFTILRIGGGNR